MNHPERITFEGYECKFMERAMRCSMGQCEHGEYCRSCEACGMTVKGFVYHCANEDKYFHTQCTNLTTPICVADVIFRLQKHGPSNCLCCNKKLFQGASKNIPGWSYVSRYKNYSIHVHCVLDMVKQHTDASSSSGGSHLTLALPLHNGSNVSKKWLNVFHIFLKTVFVILIADPTTILASTLAHFFTLVFFHAG
ncbi:hypothetical protein RND81_09G156300 [Saponaria officinalis]|uniref:DC1 domain-containing protein n=1 Tax=Saponaria officinalis TaxID=3572 RepID=A0AAW1IL70_SAPOF